MGGKAVDASRATSDTVFVALSDMGVLLSRETLGTFTVDVDNGAPVRVSGGSRLKYAWADTGRSVAHRIFSARHAACSVRPASRRLLVWLCCGVLQGRGVSW